MLLQKILLVVYLGVFATLGLRTMLYPEKLQANIKDWWGYKRGWFPWIAKFAASEEYVTYLRIWGVCVLAGCALILGFCLFNGFFKR